MLSRYPDQAATRKGYALLGTLLFAFGAIMAVFEATFMAIVGVVLALALLLPAVFFGHSAFAAVERVVGQVCAGG